jgi:8-oxo-dGTP pyrophosphatase MutT (NUDIX family)
MAAALRRRSAARAAAWENPGVVDELRTASSVIAGRDGSGGLELLVIERSRSSRFLPGYIAFPGGATHPGDADLAVEWFGSADEIARACAIRELSEETALVLTVDGMGPIGSWDPLSPVGMAPPTTDQLPEIAHWIAPEEVPVRFDARYFAIEGIDGLDPTPDGSEAVAAWWATAAALLADHESGSRKFYWPTYVTLTHVAGCASVADLLALRFETREPTAEDEERHPRSTFWQD